MPAILWANASTSASSLSVGPLPPVTGTLIENTDAKTRAVFGDYISIYDIQRAVAEKATAPIY